MESLGGRTLVEADPDFGGCAAAATAPSMLLLLLSSLAVSIGLLFLVDAVEGVVSIWRTTSSALDRGQKVVHRGLVSAAVCGKREGGREIMEKTWPIQGETTKNSPSRLVSINRGSRTRVGRFSKYLSDKPGTGSLAHCDEVTEILNLFSSSMNRVLESINSFRKTRI